MAALQPPFDGSDGLFELQEPAPPLPSVQSTSGIPLSPQSQPSQFSTLPSSSQTPSQNRLIMPVSFYASNQTTSGRIVFVDETSKSSLQGFINDDLSLNRLNRVDKHLWLAGLERPAHPLHNQVTLSRQIIITERADLHLLWQSSYIYIKPFPDYLMCHDIWQNYICTDQSTFENASGLLLSYYWLVGRESDFRIAHQHGLISEKVTWEKWRSFVSVAIRQIDFQTMTNINIRYRRGELRLARLNWIYRFCSRTRAITNMLRGYGYGYDNYGTFVTRNLTWLASATIYIVLVLTAMQVGLATDRLQSSIGFQRASYGFTVFSIIAPLIIVTAFFTVVVTVIVYNFNHASKSRGHYSAGTNNWNH